ncbi:hypothetical protein KHQ88_03635 [Mycoplasmatota bacterium]|nr:hypothetical protein KHQ88_03635 [Mycoplasmatota bacterium]
MNKHIKEITLLAIATSVLFVQELMLSFIPNIQLTSLLILVYTKVFGLKKTYMIIIVHVFIDNLLFGSLGMINVWMPMALAWLLISTLFYIVEKHTQSLIVIALTGYLFGHIYGLMFIPFQAFVLEIDLVLYLLADIPWQIIMGISNFIAILWLYNPLVDFLSNLYAKYIAN